MEFQVGDKVMLKVSPWKGVVRFGKRGKLSSRYVGPFKVLERIGDVAYKLDLPEELSRVHNTFHVSNLKKCHADEPLAVPLDGLHFDDKLQFVEEPVEIVDHKFVHDPNKTPDSSQRPPHDCLKCGNPVDGLHYFLNTSESSDDNSNAVNAPQDPFVFNQDPGENSSQSPPHIDHHCCYGCDDSLDGIFYQRCTCKSCGNGAHYSYNCPPKVPIISNPEPCHNQNFDELLHTLSSFHPTCYFGNENSFAYNSTPNFVDDSPNVFNPSPQPPTYSYEFCGNDAHYSHDYPPQVMFIYNPEPCYNQDFNFPQNFQSFQQQYPCCKSCRGPHETFQCQQKIPIYYDDDDDEESSTSLRDIIIYELPSCIAITPVLSTKEPNDSLIIRDEHLDTILEKESDEFIKSSVENLVPNPSESEDECECDVPVYDDFITFSNLLFDADDDFSSSDDKSFSDEDVSKEIYSNPFFDEEIISIKTDPRHFNAESDLIESLLNQDSLIISSS
nr:putative reverse transcriptase domain-containing protein [Tanacetum cinerariifolium]